MCRGIVDGERVCEEEEEEELVSSLAVNWSSRCNELSLAVLFRSR